MSGYLRKHRAMTVVLLVGAATGAIAYAVWLLCRPSDAERVEIAYREAALSEESLVTGSLDMGPWEAHMPLVCVELPRRAVWTEADVEKLTEYADLRMKDATSVPDRNGRELMASTARGVLFKRLQHGFGLSPGARERIIDYFVKLLSSPDEHDRLMSATQLISIDLHYADPRVRQHVLKVANDPDKWTAHVVRLNLGYRRDRIRRAVAQGDARVDARWADDAEIEALLR